MLGIGPSAQRTKAEDASPWKGRRVFASGSRAYFLGPALAPADAAGVEAFTALPMPDAAGVADFAALATPDAAGAALAEGAGAMLAADRKSVV